MGPFWSFAMKQDIYYYCIEQGYLPLTVDVYARFTNRQQADLTHTRCSNIVIQIHLQLRFTIATHTLSSLSFLGTTYLSHTRTRIWLLQ